MAKNLKIEQVKIDDIKTYENNAKLHPAEQVEQIKASIKEFGFNDPIAIDENNMIIEGHGRYIALKELGYTDVPCIRLTDLNEEQKKAYMLVHNKLTMNSGFDIDVLNDELENIVNIDMEQFDFEVVDSDVSYIDDLLDEEFVGTGASNQFAVTFLFNKDYQDTILNFIKGNGKDVIVENIINFVESKNA